MMVQCPVRPIQADPRPCTGGACLTAVYCGRCFTDRELDRIREMARLLPSRRAISRAFCTEFGWRKPDGGLKDMSCSVALLRMHRDGLIPLPPPQHVVTSAVRTSFGEALPTPPEPRLEGSRGDIARLTLDRIQGPTDSRHWNDLVARYHYLGYSPLPGAQLRYFIHGDGALLGVLGFGAAAWKIAPRDEFIGWSPEQRQARLHLVVNNARFLLLPWVSIRFLASSVLALAARYACRPLLLETFVGSERFAGTSYRAANWIYVAQKREDRHVAVVTVLGPGNPLFLDPRVVPRRDVHVQRYQQAIPDRHRCHRRPNGGQSPCALLSHDLLPSHRSRGLIQPLAQRGRRRHHVQAYGPTKDFVFPVRLDMVEVVLAKAQQPDVGTHHLTMADLRRRVVRQSRGVQTGVPWRCLQPLANHGQASVRREDLFGFLDDKRQRRVLISRVRVMGRG